MKQYITVDDLKELSNKGKEKLRKWWNPEEGDKYVIFEEIPIFIFNKRMVGDYWDKETGEKYWNKKTFYEKKSYPLLSIGQMIEFLDKHGTNSSIDDYIINERVSGGASMRVLDDYGRVEWDSGFIVDWDRRTELCDTLWQAVKEVLERE